jgi:hypothetical protein
MLEGGDTSPNKLSRTFQEMNTVLNGPHDIGKRFFGEFHLPLIENRLRSITHNVQMIPENKIEKRKNILL